MCHDRGVCAETSDSVHQAAVDLAVATVHAVLTESPTESKALLEGITSDEYVTKSMAEPIATFVTLQVDGHLRGCIGTLAALLPMYADIVKNARKATHDPRMSPLRTEEWPRLSVSVSILSQPESLRADDFDSLCAQLRPGVDGLTLKHAGQRATFLPSVWEKMPQPEQFVAALLRKGGWNHTQWPERMRAERYSTVNLHSRPPRNRIDAP